MGMIGRQLLRARRPYRATVFSPDGQQVIFRLRRPFYFINSSIYIGRNVCMCVRGWGIGGRWEGVGLGTKVMSCYGPCAAP
jgi:hypothetical protein